MRHALHLCLLLPALALAQPALQTEFPAGAVPLEPAALQKLLSGRVFLVVPAAGPPWRLQFNESYAYINVANRSDSGRWRVEGSAICMDWRIFPSGCSETRRDGDTVYLKRSTNGEVVILKPQ